MATAYAHRTFIVAPAAIQAALNTWWATNVDLEGAGDKTFTVGLSADGSAPATHYVCCTALTDAQIIAIVRRLAQMASIAVPSAGSLASRAQKISWLSSNKTALLSGTGITIIRDDGDGIWADYEQARTGLNLIPIGANGK